MRILPFSNCLRLCYKIKRRCDFAIRFAWHTSSTYTLLTPPGAAVSARQREEPLQPNFRGSWTSCRRFDLWRITSISTAAFPKNSAQRKFKLPITCARTCGISPDKILDESQSYCLPSRGLSTGCSTQIMCCGPVGGWPGTVARDGTTKGTPSHGRHIRRTCDTISLAFDEGELKNEPEKCSACSQKSLRFHRCDCAVFLLC